MEEDKDKAYRYYQPVREAIVRYCISRGKRRDQIVARLRSEADSIPTGRGQNPAEDNFRAFGVFEEHFYPQIAGFESNLLREDQKGGIEYGGIRITGYPHFVAKDKRGETRYVFLYPSNWKKGDLDAYLELLAEIIRVRFGADASSLWCMNLRTGKNYRWTSKVRVKNRCADAARHYRRLLPVD